MSTPSGKQDIRVFSETACYIIAAKSNMPAGDKLLEQMAILFTAFRREAMKQLQQKVVKLEGVIEAITSRMLTKEDLDNHTKKITEYTDRIRSYGSQGTKKGRKKAVSETKKLCKKLSEYVVKKVAWNGYDDPSWGKIRADILKRDGFRCQIKKQDGNLCGEIAVTVHHINSPNKFPELGLDGENLISACQKCHDGITREGRAVRDGIIRRGSS